MLIPAGVHVGLAVARALAPHVAALREALTHDAKRNGYATLPAQLAELLDDIVLAAKAAASGGIAMPSPLNLVETEVIAAGISTNKAAERLGVSNQQVARLCAAETIKAARLTPKGAWIIDAESLGDYDRNRHRN